MKPKPDRRPRCTCGRALVREDISHDARGRRCCTWCAKQQGVPRWDMPPVPIDRDGQRIRYPAGTDPSDYPAYLASLKGRKAAVPRKARQEALGL